METSELLKKVRKIEIKTRGLSNQVFSGEYHSAFKGRGMTFAEVREYQPGDDIRTIDWNVTARFNHPYVKVFEEEREMTVMLLVDVSASEEFGTKVQSKQELITEICAVLAFSSLQNNDKVGVIFFTDKVEKFIPPKKGRSHVLRIIRDLLEFRPESRSTDLKPALRYLTNVIRKRSTAFLISDFIAQNYSESMRIAAKKHDLVALRITDGRELELPDAGLIRFRDAETGEMEWIDTSDPDTRTLYKAAALKREGEIREIFTKSGIDAVRIDTDKGYVQPLMGLFRKRESKR